MKRFIIALALILAFCSISYAEDLGIVLIQNDSYSDEVNVGSIIEDDEMGDLTIVDCAIEPIGTNASMVIISFSLLCRSHETIVTDGLLSGSIIYLDDYAFESTDADQSLNGFPQFPPISQEYWVIYKEGFRNNRIEVAFFDSQDGLDNPIVWNKSLQLKDNSQYHNGSKYYLSSDQWIAFETGYPRISDQASDVLVSNIDVIDSHGTVIKRAFYTNDETIAPMYTGNLYLAFKIPSAAINDIKNLKLIFSFNGNEYEMPLDGK